MRIVLVTLALAAFSGWLADPEEREDPGPAGGPRRYGRPVLLPEDSALPDAFDASSFFFPEPLERDSCGSADAEDDAGEVRINGIRVFRQEHGEMPRFRGPGASVSLQPSRGFGRLRP